MSFVDKVPLQKNSSDCSDTTLSRIVLSSMSHRDEDSSSDSDDHDDDHEIDGGDPNNDRKCNYDRLLNYEDGSSHINDDERYKK